VILKSLLVNWRLVGRSIFSFVRLCEGSAQRLDAVYVPARIELAHFAIIRPVPLTLLGAWVGASGSTYSTNYSRLIGHGHCLCVICSVLFARGQ
jgi:hypothetical protein